MGIILMEALAGLKALYELVRGGVDYAVAFQRQRQEADTIVPELRRIRLQ